MPRKGTPRKYNPLAKQILITQKGLLKTGTPTTPIKETYKMKLPLRPSDCSLSDSLDFLLELKEEIDNTILDREKLILINDASQQYNRLVSMASPSYFTEMEEAVIKAIAKEWNDLIMAENEHINTDSSNINIQEIADDLEKFLNELLDNNTTEEKEE
ncbi:MAG: hypothetical protein H8D80_01560 [Proteobacteria bacterium]|nr:hypothetical protein [Pseudomonadota bacterium]